jgi:acetyl esterase
VPLDADARALIDLLESTAPPVETLSAEAARRASDERRRRSAVPGEPVHAVADLLMDGPAGPLALRTYRPSAAVGLPAVVFLHGGGWVLCDLESHDGFCRSLANAIGALVISVDYRRAPEDPYPAAVEDAFAVLRWTVAHAAELDLDPGRLVVMGDSAGGNLAASVAQMTRDRSGPRLAAQVLLYPVLDHDLERDSYRRFGEGFYLTRNAMAWYWDQYAPDSRRDEPYAAPLRSADLGGLAPAVVVVGECDPLRDEGLAYAERLTAAGVPTTTLDVAGGFHGFLSLGAVLPWVRQSFAEVAAAIRDTLEADGGDGSGPHPPRAAVGTPS